MLYINKTDMEAKGELYELLTEASLLILELAKMAKETADDMDVSEGYAICAMKKLWQASIRFDETGLIKKAYNELSGRRGARKDGEEKAEKECCRKKVGDPMPRYERERNCRYRRSGE